MCCNKFVLFVLNFILFGVGIAVISLASLVIHKTSEYGDQLLEGVITLPVIVLIIGLILTIIGFFGCFGALRESKWMLYTYASIVLVLFLAQIIVGILILVHQKEAKKIISEQLLVGFKKYPDDPSLAKSVDLLQHELECCGVKNYTDWYSIVGENTVTKGCCYETFEDDCYKNITPQSKVYHNGCFEQIVAGLRGISIGLGISAIVLAIVQLASISIACGIAKHSDNAQYA